MGLFGSTTKTKTRNYLGPEVDQYVLGDDKTSGWLPEAANLYDSSAWAPNMQWGNEQYLNLLGGRYNSPQFGAVTDAGTNAINGQFDPRLNSIGNISYEPIGDKSRVNYAGINSNGAFGSFGAANPMGALSSLLSGRVNTDALDPVADNAMRRMTESFNEQVMPGIRGGAIASGQYGGSRQGVAEGLASKGLSYGISDMIANMYNNAYNTAQQNQYGTANNLAGMGTNLASQNAENMLRAGMFNAGLDQFDAEKNLGSQQFNANLGLQNNQQQMQLMNQMLGNRTQGLGLLNSGMGMQDDLYNKYIQALTQPNEYSWGNLQNYINAANPGVNYYRSSKGRQTESPGIIPMILGGLSSMGGIMSGVSKMGGMSNMWGNFMNGVK